jgi:antitoxin component YwqK of YwqJK toxin-antitoxin module
MCVYIPFLKPPPKGWLCRYALYFLSTHYLFVSNFYSGNYKKGKKKGKFKVYEWGFLSYEGDMKGDVQSGRGKIYYPLSDQIQYEGELAGGEYDGEGTLYNEDGSIQYKGKWDMGDYAS